MGQRGASVQRRGEGLEPRAEAPPPPRGGRAPCEPLRSCSVPVSPRFTSRCHKFPPTTSPQLRGHPEWLQSPANTKSKFLTGAISPLSPPPRVNPPHLCLHPGTTASPAPWDLGARLERMTRGWRWRRSPSPPLSIPRLSLPGSVSHTSSPSVRPTLIN